MKYGYEELPEITPEQLLQKVTQQQIFELALEKRFDFHDRYTSPLRPDTKPGCRFEEVEDGTIFFVDFGDVTTHRTCFKMIMEKERLSYWGMISYIANHFGLSLRKEDYEDEPLRDCRPYRDREEGIEKPRFKIKYSPRDYAKKDRLYWSQFLIKVEELEEDSVFSVKRYWLGEREKSIVPYGLCYAIDFLHAVKIYQPYLERYKWWTNCNQDDIGNFNNLPPSGDELIISGSYKDHRVLRNMGLGLSVIWFQNEGCVPSASILWNLISRFRRIIIFFDNDDAGIIAAIKLCNILNSMREGVASMIHLPIFVSGSSWKDPAEFVSREGRKDLITMLKHLLNATDFR